MDKTKERYYQHLSTTNDTNGNPRRLWMIYNVNGNVIRVIDEGYSGRPDTQARELMPVNISPKEYNHIKEVFKSKVIWENN